MTAIVMPNDFSEMLKQLDELSRNHLLYFRLEVGKLLLQEFYDGDFAAYTNPDHNKPQKFNEFTTTCAEQLAEIGLQEQVLRQCIVAHAVVKTLPEQTVAKLLFSQVVALTRVHDAATRGVLAQATVDNGWTSKQLLDAAKAANAGKWIDGDHKAPGLQPPLPPPVDGKVTVQRLLSRYEKALATVEVLAEQWKTTGLPNATKVQKGRAKDAAAKMKQAVFG